MKIVHTPQAPQAIGPYSQAIVANGFIFVSGQTPLVPETMEIVSEDVQEQTRQALKNVQAILEAAGYSLNDVVKTTVFIKNMNDFAKINQIYAEFFNEHKPARACVEVARLPKDVLVEIECIAYKA